MQCKIVLYKAKGMKKEKIKAKGLSIQVYTQDFQNDYISLTDIAKFKNEEDPRFVIQNWLRNRNTLEFIGLWEVINNPGFNRVQFDTYKNEAGLNRFTMTPTKWIDTTAAIGIISKPGRYGGTYAHSDIALEFASWISAEFKLYIVKDYKRLKSDENSRDFASLNELLVLANMESYNAILIKKRLSQKARMTELRNLARTQILSLEEVASGKLNKIDYK